MTKKSKEKKFNIKILEIILIIFVATILIFILLTKDNNNLKAHCAVAICNESNTICYNYEINNNDTTKIIWKGDCSKLK